VRAERRALRARLGAERRAEREVIKAVIEATGLHTRDNALRLIDPAILVTNYFYSLDDHENVLELTYNHDGRTYELGTAYGHVAIGVDDLDETLARLKEQGIEPEREPYSVREGGSRLTFLRDPNEKFTNEN
jgi:lactoylglutathione lyase